MRPLSYSVMWVIESSAAVCLALNRCVEMASHYWAKVLYDGNRAWWWMLGCTTYGIWHYFYSKPAFFTGIYVAWFYNPHVGYFADVDGTVENTWKFRGLMTGLTGK